MGALIGSVVVAAWVLLSPPSVMAQESERQPASESAETAPSPSDADPEEALPTEALGEEDAPSTRAPGRIEEIVVTAEKRATTVQTTPIAISAFSGKQLDETGVVQIQDLAFQVPNLHYGQVAGDARITIRGVSSTAGSDQSTAFHVDGVYQNQPGVAGAFTFFDVQRVEVLRGPQGTLYGRNATGGALNVISNPPTDEVELLGDLQLGTYDQVLFRGVVNLPILEDRLATRVAMFLEDRRGYQRNFAFPRGVNDYDDAQDIGVRAQVLFEPTDALRMTGRFNYFERSGVGFALKQIGPISETVEFDNPVPGAPPLMLPIFYGASPNPENLRQVNLDGQGSRSDEMLSGNLEVDWDIETIDATWKIIGSYLNRDVSTFTDQDATDIFVTHSDVKSWTHEWVVDTHLSSNGGGDFDWVIGLFHLGTQGEGTIDAPSNFRLAPPNPPLQPNGIVFPVLVSFEDENQAYSAAVYGNAAYHFTDSLKVDAGLRYSHDWKSSRLYRPEVPIPIFGTLFAEVLDIDGDDWGRVSGMVGLDYQLDEHLFYGKFSTGYKAGALNDDIPLILNPVIVSPPNAEPEQIYAVEMGTKSQFFDSRVRLNTAFFFYYYEDLQVSQVLESAAFLDNAASARTVGLELELTWLPFDELLIAGNFGFLNARFIEYECADAEFPGETFDCDGKNQLRAPDFSGSVSAQYTLALGRYGSLVPYLQVSASDEVFFRPRNLEKDRQGAYALLNLRLGWWSNNGRFGLEGFVDNVTDEDVATTKVVGSSLLNAPIFTAYDRPRTAGIRMSLEF